MCFGTGGICLDILLASTKKQVVRTMTTSFRCDADADAVEFEMSFRFQGRGRPSLGDVQYSGSDDGSVFSDSSRTSGGIVFESLSDDAGFPPDRRVPDRPDHDGVPKLSLSVASNIEESVSLQRLLDLQENEFIAIRSIFGDAVRELPLQEEAAVIEREAVKEQAQAISSTRSFEGLVDMTPVRRYGVKLTVRSGCSAGGAQDVDCQDGGPTVELEVCYGQLYPLKSPRLLLYNIDGLPRQARQDLRILIREELRRLFGRECVYDVCMAVLELLRAHYDPCADLPLHERFKLHEAEQAERQRAVEEEDRNRVKREKADSEMRQQLERQRLQDRQVAAKRMGEAFHRGGHLSFLPEESPMDPANMAENGRCVQMEKQIPNGKPLEPVGRYQSDFEEVNLLGRGGFGSVTKVVHRVDKHAYAIKRIELFGASSNRFQMLQECATLPQLSHAHIVRYYQAWIERDSVQAEPSPLGHAVAQRGMFKEGLRQIRRISSTEFAGGDIDWPSQSDVEGGWQQRPSTPCHVGRATTLRESLYIQMEYCDGKTLREAINGGQVHQDVALIWKLFRQILDGLAYIHSKGLIHRDLKPPNIFLCQGDGGHAKIGDFGLTTKAHLPAGSESFENGSAVSAAVGTVFYMAPEIAEAASARAASKVQNRNRAPRGKKRTPQDRPAIVYNTGVDMFSLGIIFFEMWHPPFTTCMERARILEFLAAGLSDLPSKTRLADVLKKCGAPQEVMQILASLLAKHPEDRMHAQDLLDSNSGLLPPGAYDPQVQRILKALESPGSTESVALVEALFARFEDPARDRQFFEQAFHASSIPDESIAQVRDALLQLFKEVCRLHGVVYDLCPLMRPARVSANASTEVGRSIQLLDRGNTRVELRCNLTEPFARAGAAKFTAEDFGQVPCVRRRYHTGTIYQSFKGAQHGHPMETSSAVAQFLWQPHTPSAGSGLPRETSESQRIGQALEAELLHILAEILMRSGVAAGGGHIELQLADTRLLAYAAESVAQRGFGLRDARSQDVALLSGTQSSSGDRPSSGDQRVNRQKRLMEAICARMPPGVLPSGREKAACELAAFFAGACEGRAVGSEALKSWPVSIKCLAELQECYATSPGESQTPSSPSVGEKLWKLLQNLQVHAKVLEGLVDITCDVLRQGREDTYAPGLVWRVYLHNVNAPSTLICEGGRVDNLIAQFMDRHHTPEPRNGRRLSVDAAILPPSLCCGASFELAVDRLTAALVQADAEASSVPTGSHWRRGARHSCDKVPWWRQLPGCWPLVLVGAVRENDVGERQESCLSDEVLLVTRGLWRLGIACEAHTTFLDASSAAHWQHVGCEAGGLRPDFVLFVFFQGAQQEIGCSEDGCNFVECNSGVKTPSSPPSFKKPASPPPSKKGGAFVRTSSPGAQYYTGRHGSSTNMDDVRIMFEVRARSEQAFEIMGRTTKDQSLREFDDRHRVIEFFEKLSRRLPNRPLGHLIPKTAFETPAER